MQSSMAGRISAIGTRWEAAMSYGSAGPWAWICWIATWRRVHTWTPSSPAREVWRSVAAASGSRVRRIRTTWPSSCSWAVRWSGMAKAGPMSEAPGRVSPRIGTCLRNSATTKAITATGIAEANTVWSVSAYAATTAACCTRREGLDRGRAW